MATTIFAENFRGFRTIDISLKNGAFLVGDNSSGKTSILHLIDYAINSELVGPPQLNESVGVGKYDFFSPYFNESDVTIGLKMPRENGTAWKVVTLQKRDNGFFPKVTACSYAFGNTAYCFRASDKDTTFRIDNFSDEITKETLLASHHNRDNMAVAHLGRDQSLINNKSYAHIALQRAGLADAQDDNIFSAMYSGPTERIRHLGPLRSKPERYYQPDRRHDSSGSHFAPMFRDVRGPKSAKLKAAVKKFGVDSKLFDHLDVKPISKTMDDSPLVVTIKRNGRTFLISQVGVGVSQVAPIIVDATFALQANTSTILLVQQPELHLHPVAQAALGEFLFEAAKQGLVTFCETHSDYLIDRFRACIRETKGEATASVLYCFTDSEGNHCRTVDISPDGTLTDPPEEYFDFFINEFARTTF